MHFQHIVRFGLAIGAFLVLAAGPAAAKSCSIATLDGTYGVLSSGNSGKNSPTAGVFRLVTDGQGKVTGTGTLSDNGTIENETFSGTYTVAKNCTGTMALVDQNKIHADYNFIFDEGNSHFEFIRTDSGYNESGEGETLGTSSCSLSTKAIFANRTREFGSFLVDIVGQLTLSGTGNANAIETFSINGALQTAKMTGTYTLSSDCTGTVTLSASGITYHFALLAVGAQKTLMLIDTDSNNINAGIANAQ